MLNKEEVKKQLTGKDYDDNFDILEKIIYDYFYQNSAEVILFLRKNKITLDMQLVEENELNSVDELVWMIMFEELKDLIGD